MTHICSVSAYNTTSLWRESRVTNYKNVNSLITANLRLRPLGKNLSFFNAESESRSVMYDSLRPHGLYSSRNSAGQNTGVGSLSLLQGIFPSQDRTQVSRNADGFFTSWATRETPLMTGVRAKRRGTRDEILWLRWAGWVEVNLRPGRVISEVMTKWYGKGAGLTDSRD